MKQITLAVALLLAFAVFISTFGCVGGSNSSSSVPSVQTVTAEPTKASPELSSAITMAEIAKHNTPDNCWLAINGIAYAIPANFQEMHKGGAMYLPYCGKDATKAFNGIKDGQGHPAKANEFAANWLIGKVTG